MIKKALLPVALLACMQLEADTFSNEVENAYVRGVNSILFFTSENIISSGKYEFGSSDETLNTHFLPVTYHFKNDSDFYNFYVNGSVGYSNYKEKNIDIRPGSIDDLRIKTYAIKLGGGVRLNVSKDTDMMFGASYIYSKVNSDYNAALPLLPANPVDKVLDYVFNSNKDYNTYELFTSVGYHPTINEYEPYVRADIRYFDTKIDDPQATISDTSSTISKLKIGVITPAVTTIEGLPLKLEFYASEVFLGGDMDDSLGVDKFTMVGTTFHLGTTSLNDWVSDVSFDVNIVRGNNLSGFNFGFGLSF
jgi:hypothetical protein